jgi:hypothetical protein
VCGDKYFKKWWRPETNNLKPNAQMKALWRTPLAFVEKDVARQCDQSIMVLHCPLGQGSIRIDSAVYGRPNPSKFAHGCGGHHKGNAAACPKDKAVSVKAIVTKQCTGKVGCRISVCPSTFKQEKLCEGIPKYLEVKYACVKEKATRLQGADRLAADSAHQKLFGSATAVSYSKPGGIKAVVKPNANNVKGSCSKYPGTFIMGRQWTPPVVRPNGAKGESSYSKACHTALRGRKHRTLVARGKLTCEDPFDYTEFTLPGRKPIRNVCMRSGCIKYSPRSQTMEYLCGNDDLGLTASLVNAVARKEDTVTAINDLDILTMTRTYPGKPITFVYSRKMDFTWMWFYVAPVGFKPGTTTKEVAYYFDVECFVNNKWETVYKWPHFDPLCHRYDKKDPKKCTHPRAFDLRTGGWRPHHFGWATNDRKKNGKYEHPLKPWETRQRKCSQPSAKWRLNNIRGHSKHPIKTATTYDIHFAGWPHKEKEAIKGVPTQPLPPLGGKCGMTIRRSGNKDIIRWGRCPEKETSTTYRCSDVEGHFEPVAGRCDSVTDLNPGTFSRFRTKTGALLRRIRGEVIPVERVWLFKHKAHHEIYTLRSFVFMCGKKGKKDYWEQKFDLAAHKEWSGIKHGWAGVWLCKACTAKLMAVRKFTSQRHHPKAVGHIYIAELFFAPSTVTKATLPMPLNGKIQKEWCVRHQTVIMPFAKKHGKWPQLWPLAMRGMGSSPAMTRTMGIFKPDFEGFPCGSNVAVQMMFQANKFKAGDRSWCTGSSWLSVRSPCNEKIAGAGKHFGSGGTTHLLDCGPSKFEGWPKSLVDVSHVEVTALGAMYSKYCGSARQGRRKPVNAIGNKLEFIYWYRPADISAPCAERDV